MNLRGQVFGVTVMDAFISRVKKHVENNTISVEMEILTCGSVFKKMILVLSRAVIKVMIDIN